MLHHVELFIAIPLLALMSSSYGDPYPGPNGLGSKNCGGGVFNNGWCQAGLYCAQNMGATSQNECKTCPCHGHGSCGRGTNKDDGGGGDGPNGGYPGPCECDDGHWGFDCTDTRCSGSACQGGAWGLGLQELNLILDRFTIHIPEPQGGFKGTVKVDPLSSGLDWTLKKVVCQHLGVGGIKVTAHEHPLPTSNLPDLPRQERYMDVYVEDITVECTADWTFQYIFEGEGRATARAQPSDHNSVHVGAKYHSQDFSSQVPDVSQVKPTCKAATVNFGKFSMHGTNVGGTLASMFDGAIKEQIQSALLGSGGPDSALCEQLGEMTTNILTPVLVALNAGLEPLMYFINTTAPAPKNITGREMQLKADCTSVAKHCPPPPLVDFSNNWIVQLLQLGATKLSSPAASTCRRDWQGIQRCTGPLVVNEVVGFITSQLGGSGQIDIVDFFGIFDTNTTFTTEDSAVIGVEIEVESLKINGLDSFVKFNILESIGNYTFFNELVLDYLGMAADVRIKLTPSADGSGVVVSGGPPIEEHATLHAGMENATVTLAALLAVAESIAVLPLGTVASQPTGCLMSKVFLANLTYANVTVSGLRHPMLKGFVSEGVDDLFNGIADTAFMLYEEIALKIAPGLIQSKVRTAINDILFGYINDDANVICPPCDKSTTHPCVREPILYMDFEKTSEVTYVAWLINEAIGVDNLNTAIGSLTQALSGTHGKYTYDAYLVDSTTVMKDGHDTPTRKGSCFTCSRIGRIQIRVSDLTVTGLDTFGEMSLLHPTAPYTVHNAFALASSTRPLNVSLSVVLKVDGTAITIDDEFELSLSLHGVKFVLDILLKIDQGKFWGLKLNELTEIANYLATLAAARPERFQLTFAKFGLHINCKNLGCSSQKLVEMAANLRRPVNIAQLTGKVNEFVANIGRHFVEDPQVQENYLKMLAQYSDEALNQTGCVDIYPACKVWASTLQCKVNPEYMQKYCRVSCGVCSTPVDEPDTETDNFWMHIFAAASSVIGCCVVAGCCFPYCSKKTSVLPSRTASTPDLTSKTLQASLLVNVVAEASDSPRKRAAAAVQNGTSLFRSDAVPLWTRRAVPLCLFANICLFVTGHLSIGATVDVDIKFAGDSVRVDRFVEFSLGNSLKDMYNAHAMVLFYFIGCFSGLWPYTKLLLMLYCWFAPPGCLRPATRGSLLAKLDYAGTWSLIDLYVLVMTMLGFHLNIASPTSLAFVPTDFYVVKAMVTPVWGLYAFMLGVIFSLIINYLCLHFHRQERTAAEDCSSPAGNTTEPPIMRALDPSQNEKEALMAHVFEGRGFPYRFDFRSAGQKGVCVMLALSLLLTLIGGLLVSFQFKVHGIAGVLSDVGTPGSSLQRFSIVSSAAAVAAQGPARYLGSFGPALIAVVYVSFAFLVPLTVLLLMVAQWVLPMTLRAQKRLYTTVEALTAWSALEVFMAAIIVAMLEIGQVSGFIVGKNCDGITDWLGDLVTYGLLDPSDVTCFLIEADIQSGRWVLGRASLFAMITNRTVNKLAHEAILDRERRQAKEAVTARRGAGGGDGSLPGSDNASKADNFSAGCVERLMHCTLLGSGFIHTWDKAWDAEFRSIGGAPSLGGGSGGSTSSTAAVQDLFSTPVSSARSLGRLPPPPLSPSMVVASQQQQDEEMLSPSACAKRAVSLDREGGDQRAAAAWYSRAAAALVEKSKSEACPSDAKVKCLAKANEYDTRAQVLYAQPGNASADV